MSQSRFSKAVDLFSRIGILGALKSVYWNLRIFPFRDAILLPVLMTGKTHVKHIRRGSIVFTSKKLRPGILQFGTLHQNYTYNSPLFLSIWGKLTIHGNGGHHFGPGCIMSIAPSANLEFGNNSTVGANAHFIILSHSKIGDDNMHSFGILYMDNDSHAICNLDGKRINPEEGFEIGNKVWIGAHSRIMKGAKIADGCIVGTNSLVTKNLDTESSIYVSNRLLRTGVSWTSECLGTEELQ